MLLWLNDLEGELDVNPAGGQGGGLPHVVKGEAGVLTAASQANPSHPRELQPQCVLKARADTSSPQS
eukprot:5742077-Amphidinium_carterae.1